MGQYVQGELGFGSPAMLCGASDLSLSFAQTTKSWKLKSFTSVHFFTWPLTINYWLVGWCCDRAVMVWSCVFFDQMLNIANCKYWSIILCSLQRLMSLSELTLTPNYKDIDLQAGNWKWIAVVHFRKPCIHEGYTFWWCIFQYWMLHSFTSFDALEFWPLSN